MHGVIAMGRIGRKRKAGARKADGRLRERQFINYTELAGEQPHRRDLPQAFRTSAEAATELGQLYLCRKISEPQYLAGQEYVRRIGAYRVTIGGPRVSASAGRGYDCNPEQCEPCECLFRRNSYSELHDVLASKGYQVARVASNVIAHGQKPTNDEIAILCVGLSALVKHLRLTTRGKSEHARNSF